MNFLAPYRTQRCDAGRINLRRAESARRQTGVAAGGEVWFWGVSCGILTLAPRLSSLSAAVRHLPTTEASNANVLIPKAGISLDEFPHQPDASLIL